MYSLFWKIFLTFWFTILIVELITAWVTADLSENEIHPILEQQNFKFIQNTKQAVRKINLQGLTGFQQWRQKNNLEAIDELYVIDVLGKEISGNELPDEIIKILKDHPFDQTVNDDFKPVQHLLSFKATAPDNNEFIVITTFQHPHLVSYLLAPQRVALGVIISGLICFLLARYFTSPLTRLRRSTQMLAQSNFNIASLKHLRKRNDEFGALAIDFENMANRLNQMLDAQRQLLRDISHELRSPLTRIRVALGLARNQPHAGAEQLDRIEREIERLEQLIRELLTFVRIGPSYANACQEKVDVHEMLEQIAEDAAFEQKQNNKNQNIKINCPSKIETCADALLLHRAVENIVRNACYYSPDNSTIKIHCQTKDNAVIIAVEDSGPGIPQNMLEQVFQPFVRVSQARESDTGGSGIGLAIAKRVVELHRGTIEAYNKSNSEGLIVKITLPHTSLIKSVA